MGDAVAEFAAFVDGTGGLGGDVATDEAGEGELLEEATHAFGVFAFVGIDFGVGAFQVDWPEDAGCAVTGPRHKDHVEVVFVDQAVAVQVGEAEGWGGTPVPQQAMFDVGGLQRRFQQWVIAQVYHPHG